MHLVLVILGFAVLPAVIYGASRKAIKHLQWNDCGNENATVNLLTLDVYPVPVEIPGDIHINGVNIQSTSPLNNVTIQLSVESKIFIGYIPMPCLLGIGSCSYDLCSFVEKYADQEDKIPDFIYNALHFTPTDNDAFDDVDVGTNPPATTVQQTEVATMEETRTMPAITMGGVTTPAVTMGETTASVATMGEVTTPVVTMGETTTPEVTMGQTTVPTVTVDATTSSAVTMGETTAPAATIGEATKTAVNATASATTLPTEQMTTTARPTTPTTTLKTISTTKQTTHRPYLHLSCPLQPVNFNLDTPYTYSIKKLPGLLAIFAAGDYKVKAQILSQESEELGCVQFNVTIKKKKEPGSGWFFRKRRNT